MRRWASVVPVACAFFGAFVAVRAGAMSPARAATAYAPNVAAVLVGIVLLRIVSRRAIAVAGPWLALAALASTLAFPGQDGVHRWIIAGPVQLNASAALGPLVLVGLLDSEDALRWSAIAPLLLAQALHFAQPDAGQAFALAAAASPLLLLARGSAPRLAGLTVVGLFAGTLLRPDPLVALDHVEGTLRLARAVGPVAFALALVLLGLAVLGVSGARGRRGAMVSAGWLVGATAASAIGAFPVPLLGAGAGPVLGFYALSMVVRRGNREP